MKYWCLEVWGDYACFTRPEMKVERVSYDCMTPSAARAILEAILWKPAIKWNIVKIEILNPIKWIGMRRNEVGNIASERGNAIFVEDIRQQRAGLFLRDVCYRIYAFFDFIPINQRVAKIAPHDLFAATESEEHNNETEAKYAAMFERRAKSGQCFHRPYLGCREFACNFKLIDDDNSVKPIDVDSDLGWMLYDIDFSNKTNPQPEFFHAKLESGVLNTDRRYIEVRK